MGVLPFLIGLAASTCVIVNGIPQAAKIWRTGSAAGVSVPMWILFYGLLCLWLGYGIRVGNLTLIVANVGTMATSTAVLVAIARSRGRNLALVVAGIAALSAVLVTIALVAPVAVLAVVFFAATGLTWIQTVKSIQTWRTHGHSNVSLSAFYLRAAANALWIVQTVFTGDRLLLFVSILTLSGAVSVIVFELLIRRQHSLDHTPVEEISSDGGATLLPGA